MGGHEQLATISVRDGRVHDIFAALNPDKLTRIHL
ncbi:MAG: hypothetical protein QOE54_6466 [Streptosporangiaceae bacterium]|jgi:RNA polymerase sigma-70 factor (ECF subfamily)|nr:hypothetical protein [Streptosporangiaceae bacterium]